MGVQNEMDARSQFEFEIQVLLNLVVWLPGPTESPDKLKEVLTWSFHGVWWGNFKYDDFKISAAEVSPEAESLALLIELSMKRLDNCIEPVRAAKLLEEYDWNAFPWTVWNTSIQLAREGVWKLRKEVRSSKSR